MGQRTLHLEKKFGIWKIENDAPDYGQNVPDEEFYMEYKAVSASKPVNIENLEKNGWVIRNENGNPYSIGTDYKGERYYSYRYIEDIYRTKDGRVYVLDMKTFLWRLTEMPYSELDYLGNYTKVSKDEAEKIISEHRQKTVP